MPLQGVTPELVWLLLAACGDAAVANYKLTVSDVAFVLGAASAIARALEAEGDLPILGTVAGDDTVFVATASRREGDRVRNRVLALV